MCPKPSVEQNYSKIQFKYECVMALAWLTKRGELLISWLFLLLN